MADFVPFNQSSVDTWTSKSGQISTAQAHTISHKGKSEVRVAALYNTPLPLKRLQLGCAKISRTKLEGGISHLEFGLWNCEPLFLLRTHRCSKKKSDKNTCGKHFPNTSVPIPCAEIILLLRNFFGHFPTKKFIDDFFFGWHGRARRGRNEGVEGRRNKYPVPPPLSSLPSSLHASN